ncbi:MAG: hypothetical protein AAGJ80_02390, partial [Cyanobacteria bacterium J06553_1]
MFQNLQTACPTHRCLPGKWRGVPPEEVLANSLPLLSSGAEEWKISRCPHQDPEEVVIDLFKVKVSETGSSNAFGQKGIMLFSQFVLLERGWMCEPTPLT